ncbi:zinc finger C2HC domain-containing protein 1A-like [Uloborus diversus]|uniref:zinc finger C2HC domain-containing protein 1A-like n=1 Tax=Uloborus diversus TaxID=327109 RepID=UPI00240A94B7|nr:zinc finger C2HC domain-containing protein 1A-like [Uloborus diversus]
MIKDPPEAGCTELRPCAICGRTFRPDALIRHQNVCEKNAVKKRKVFDSSKQRAPEEAQKIQTRTKPQPKQVPSKNEVSKNESKQKKSNWREKHEELIQTIQRARGKDDGKDKATSGEGPAQKKVPSDYVQCPSCQRHFNQRAAERHIPWCQQKKNSQPSKSPQPMVEAKEKLIARVRYRPPQGKARILHRKMKTAHSSPNLNLVSERQQEGPRSSPPTLLDKRNNTRNATLDRVNNNVPQKTHYRRSGSRSREKEQTITLDLPQHIIKFKEKFPNHIYKRNVDLEDSLTSEQLRELLSCSRITDRCPKTVPGVRLSGGHSERSRNDNWNYRSTDVSRSASSSGGSTNGWNKRLTDPRTLPEVSSSELPGTWASTKLGWTGDLDQSMSSSGSSSGGSLPPLSRESNSGGETSPPVAFYCHQCNSKFPLIAAKYCCECGARRRGTGSVCINQTG